FSDRTVLVPCFHDEPLARLRLWPTLYSEAGGILYHSAEEQAFAQCELGVHDPNTWEIGTWLPLSREGEAPAEPWDDRTRRVNSARREPRPPGPGCLVYCGRYSE